MTRWKASAIHLALSVLVLATIGAILVWRWYPPGLFQMAHADKLLLIIAGVDVAMGPLLTLIVYKQGKKSLKFDLAVIALLQLAAMGYGLHTVWQSRPVYMVAVIDRFNLVFASDMDPADVQAATDEYRQLPWLTVRTVAAVLPEDPKLRTEFLKRSSETGYDIHLMPRYYAPYRKAVAQLLAHSATTDSFAARLAPDQAADFASAVAATGRDPGQLRVVPVSSTRGDATMLIDAQTGDPLKPVALDPWPGISPQRSPK
jgi:hypothetical protein